MEIIQELDTETGREHKRRMLGKVSVYLGREIFHFMSRAYTNADTKRVKWEQFPSR